MPLEIKDLAGVSEPAKKLLETVSAGIGVLYEPTRIRRKARAEADAQLIQTRAEIERDSLLRRAAERISYRELQRQQNIDNIVAEAYEQLPEHADQEPVNPDWLATFFDECQSVSDEKLQAIWGRILAGEVSGPGTFSRITLAVLRNISQEDARLFQRVTSLFWTMDDWPFVPFELYNTPMPLLRWGVNHDECMHLDAMGLLNVKRDLFAQVVNGAMVCYFHQAYRLDIGIWPLDAGNLNIFSLTRAGRELFRIVEREYNSEWEQAAVKLMAEKWKGELVPWYGEDG